MIAKFKGRVLRQEMFGGDGGVRGLAGVLGSMPDGAMVHAYDGPWGAAFEVVKVCGRWAGHSDAWLARKAPLCVIDWGE